MNIFEHIGGVPTKLWFDNLTPAVKDILKHDGREMTEKWHMPYLSSFPS